MPKAVARKVEFTLYRHDLDVDLQLIPLALTPDQCRRFRLPRTPIKDTEKRKDKFEQTFGVGATELDAMEALHPGELGRLLDEELDNFLDADLGQRIRRAYHNELLPLNLIEADVRAAHAEEISDIEERFAEIVEELEALKSEAGDLWQTMADEMEEELPDLSGVEIPRSDAPGETDTFVLFDSTRDYLTQMDFYNQWKEGEEDFCMSTLDIEVDSATSEANNPPPTLSDGLELQLNGRWRVTADGQLQWLLQQRRLEQTTVWISRSWCRTRKGLLRCVREHCGEIDPVAQAILQALPDYIGEPDYNNYIEPVAPMAPVLVAPVAPVAPVGEFASGPTPGALQGDDYPLEFDADGDPVLTECLRRGAGRI